MKNELQNAQRSFQRWDKSKQQLWSSSQHRIVGQSVQKSSSFGQWRSLIGARDKNDSRKRLVDGDGIFPSIIIESSESGTVLQMPLLVIARVP